METSIKSPEPILRGGTGLGAAAPDCCAIPTMVCAHKRSQKVIAHASVFAILFPLVLIFISVGAARRRYALSITVPIILGIYAVAVGVEILQAEIDIVDNDAGYGSVHAPQQIARLYQGAFARHA